MSYLLLYVKNSEVHIAMKRFLFGLGQGLLVGLLLSLSILSLSAFADQPIKLIVNGKEIQCDVPPQIINGRTMIPARFLAEALGAKVDWDADNNVVQATSIDQSDVSIKIPYEKFNTGLVVTRNSGFINVKVIRDQLPDTLKNFKKISVCSIEDPSPAYIMSVFDWATQPGCYTEDYDQVNGTDEASEGPIYLVILFNGRNNNPLGYSIITPNCP